MRSLSLLLVFILVVFTSHAQQQQQENYSRARIYLDQQNHSLLDLAALGLAVDHGEYKKNTYFTSDFSESEIQKAKNAGFKVEIIIADVVKHYQNQNKKNRKNHKRKLQHPHSN